MLNSGIEWTDHTWNIAVGCSKIDADCKFCYMFRDSLDGTRYTPNVVRKTKTVFNSPLKIKEPSKIFTSSLTDVFHEDVDSFRKEMWDIIMKCPQHTFQILTKRPIRIDRKTLPFQTIKENGVTVGGKMYSSLPNVWIGTSIGHYDGLHRLNELLNSLWTGIKFLSLEPLHGPLDFASCLCDRCGGPLLGHGIDWVIVGGESGNENGKYRYRECKIEWIESIIDDCKENDIPVFVKQLGTHLSKKLGLKSRHGKDINEWPEHLRIRQFPITNV
jgi:protein gp37